AAARTVPPAAPGAARGLRRLRPAPARRQLHRAAGRYPRTPRGPGLRRSRRLAAHPRGERGPARRPRRHLPRPGAPHPAL
ncbi:MAG: hypothetical protein AVDCRST_MAG18-4889, partial [uncultured Thermomicrobiales bacterium]